MAIYRLATESERAKYAPELVGQEQIIVFDKEKYWVVKHRKSRLNIVNRELLGFILGRDLTNVAEVKLLSQDEHREVQTLSAMGVSSLPINTCLVRLGGSYSIEELPCKTLEQAVARELVYSIWIRRRDTHAYNRVYVDGIPIFFDHNIAFFADPEYAHSTAFFKTARDHGYPKSWRVKERAGKMTTKQARGVPSENEKAYHYVNDINQFKKELELAEKEMRKTNLADVKQAISDCGFDKKELSLIDNFLSNNLKTLSSDIEQMLEIIFKK